ncbi:MAG: hypothetical protein QOI59_1572, partial [Gammaproteobacteria bacterium]|nr:hypothetical protein [Gammaproteobacteria bacterium]
MDPQRVTRTYILKNADCSLRVDVLCRHEPPRLVGANGNQRNIRCTITGAQVLKDGAVPGAAVVTIACAHPSVDVYRPKKLLSVRWLPLKRLLDPLFSQFPRQRPAMHTEASRGLRNVESRLSECFVDA